MVKRRCLAISVLLLTASESHLIKNGATVPNLPAISLKRCNKSPLKVRELRDKLKRVRVSNTSFELGNSSAIAHATPISVALKHLGVAERKKLE